MKILMLIAFSGLFISINSFAEKKEDPNKINKINKYLQIDEITIPKGLNEIDFEIRQNTIDVVLNSPKYIFLTSKRDKIVNKNYKDYNSLKVKLRKTSSKAYVAEIHLENWYTAKYDRKFNMILSKYNLLTDLRMGIYELLYGKVYVRKNREKLIQYSAIRIKKLKKLALNDPQNNKSGGGGGGGGGKGKGKGDQDPSKESKEEKDKKKKDKVGGDSTSKSSGSKGKKKEDKKKEDKKEEEEIAKTPEEEKKKKKESDSDSNDPSRSKSKIGKTVEEKTEGVAEIEVEDEPKKDRSGDPRISQASEVKDIQQPEDPPPALSLFEEQDLFDNPPRIFIGKKSIFSAKLLYTAYDVKSSNYLLNTGFTMNFLRFGANINVVEERINPLAYEFTLLAGSSVSNELFQIPAWRTIEAGIAKYIFSNTFKFGVGLESSPFYFINLPEAGEGEQLYELDIIWAKGHAELYLNIYRRELVIGTSYASTTLVKSSIDNYEVTGIKTEYYARYFLTPKYGAEFSSSAYSFTGTDQGEEATSSGTNYSLNFIAKFN